MDRKKQDLRYEELYNKLLDPSNWYFSLPVWTTNK